jgi:3-hydroxybutyryl-CoA dehydratase
MSSPLDITVLGTTVADRLFGPITRQDLRRYAEASGDLNPLHLEPEFARQAGFDDVIVHGMLGMALLGRLVTESFSQHRLVAFGARFRHIIRVGEAIHCRARLEARENDACVLALEALSPAGALLIEATATLSQP